MPKTPAEDNEFVKQLKEGILKGLADAHADGGAAADAAREARYNRIKPLYAGITPPPLNEDGSLKNPDAGPPAEPKAKKKAKKPAKKTPKKK